MWPFESSRQETLRIGRLAIERWRGAPGQLECVASHALAAPLTASRWSGLGAALNALHADKPASPVTLLLESACMPVIAVEAGAALWKPEQMLALARHRLHALHAESGPPAPDWDIRIDYRAGDPAALAFCMAPSLRQALLDAATAAGFTCRRLLPALAWGLGAIRPVARHHGWLAWEEQDRTLLAGVRAGTVHSLNAAALRTTDGASVLRQVASERMRRGVLQLDVPVLATRWHGAADSPASRAGAGVAWFDLDRGSAPGAVAASALPRRVAAQP